MQFTRHIIHQPIRYSVATRFGSTNVVMTHKVADLGLKAVGVAVEAISYFDDFCRLAGQRNNHELGVIEIEDHLVMFEISQSSVKSPTVGVGRLIRLARVDELNTLHGSAGKLHS